MQPRRIVGLTFILGVALGLSTIIGITPASADQGSASSPAPAEAEIGEPFVIERSAPGTDVSTGSGIAPSGPTTSAEAAPARTGVDSIDPDRMAPLLVVAGALVWGSARRRQWA